MRFVFELALNGKPSGEPSIQEFESQEIACGAAVSCLQMLADASPRRDRGMIYDLRVLSEAGVLLCSASLATGPQAKDALGEAEVDAPAS